MIVQEQHISPEEKNIKPTDAGGVAGGTKFSIHNLFLKYPVDNMLGKTFLYGGNNKNDNYAAKASNHDLNGITHCMIADDLVNPTLNFPLTALIDYQGFRLTVMTTLPISHETLLYGSSDAGKTMYKEKNIHEHMLCVAKKLNLRPHLSSNENPTEMAMCGDIEIHSLKDKSLFGLDMARIFPPALPLGNSSSGSIF